MPQKFKKGDKLAIGEGVCFTVTKETKTHYIGEESKGANRLGISELCKEFLHLVTFRLLQ